MGGIDIDGVKGRDRAAERDARNEHKTAVKSHKKRSADAMKRGKKDKGKNKKKDKKPKKTARQETADEGVYTVSHVLDRKTDKKVGADVSQVL